MMIYLKFAFSALLVAITSVLFAQETEITATSNPTGWIIRTDHSAYQLLVDKNGKVKPVAYGPRALTASPGKNAAWFEGVDEIPVRGGVADKSPVLEVIFADMVRDADLKFETSEILVQDGRPTLKIVQKDTFYQLQVISYIRVVKEFDILEKWIEVKNRGAKGGIQVDNLQSGSIVLPKNEYVLNHMMGKWSHEFQPVKTALTPGTKILETRDFKSMNTPPWYFVQPADASSGEGWFGTIAYSGNWRIGFDKFFDGNLQVTAGINFWDTKLTLLPGKSFVTPKFISGYTTGGNEGAAQALSAYVRTEVLPASHRTKLRPVLYNSWYATLFNVNEEQQLALAKTAKEIGVEMFVIDDGWFKGRINDKGGLGDWETDKIKFPNGLQPLIKKINDMGMDFGIWIEPEMVNPNSDLYRAHPDWVLNFPNRTRTEKRNQLTLNLAREDVYQYLLAAFTKLLKENNIKYIKWDHNRMLTEPGWPDAPAQKQQEVRIRYVENLYRMVDELRSKFPDVWFENCSSGGGRVDLGLLSRMDMAWVSDNTDPLDRLMIQYGYLSAFPANAMISWVTKENHHQPLPLAFKFDVSMSGVLGVGNDLTQWKEEDINIAKAKIAQYKQIRPMVQNGTAHRLISPFEGNRCAIQYADPASGSSVVFCYDLAEYLAGSRTAPAPLLKLKGLNRDQFYTITKTAGVGSDPIRGDFLEDAGIAWPLTGANKSIILTVTQVKK